jgi:hypothetical protein
LRSPCLLHSHVRWLGQNPYAACLDECGISHLDHEDLYFACNLREVEFASAENPSTVGVLVSKSHMPVGMETNTPCVSRFALVPPERSTGVGVASVIFDIIGCRRWRSGAAERGSLSARITIRPAVGLVRFYFWENESSRPMKQPKKQWTKPAIKTVPIFFECTCYAGTV